jgi:hypothetical protein
MNQRSVQKVIVNIRNQLKKARRRRRPRAPTKVLVQAPTVIHHVMPHQMSYTAPLYQPVPVPAPVHVGQAEPITQQPPVPLGLTRKEGLLAQVTPSTLSPARTPPGPYFSPSMTKAELRPLINEAFDSVNDINRFLKEHGFKTVSNLNKDDMVRVLKEIYPE